jgi:hypothetical protein
MDCWKWELPSMQIKAQNNRIIVFFLFFSIIIRFYDAMLVFLNEFEKKDCKGVNQDDTSSLHFT